MIVAIFMLVCLYMLLGGLLTAAILEDFWDNNQGLSKWYLKLLSIIIWPVSTGIYLLFMICVLIYEYITE